MLTGYDSPSMLIDALLAGADDFFVKSHLPGGLLKQVKSLTDPSSIDARSPCAFLHSKGLTCEQIQLLSNFALHDFPSIKDLASQQNTTTKAVSKRLVRIKEKLNLKSNGSLIQLLTILKAYTAKQKLKSKANNETL